MRKTLDVTITAEGRDKGKMFRITEMPAEKAEKWAIRALMAAARNGIEVPDDVQGAGMAGVAVMGIQALTKIDYMEVEPLLDEMWGCIQIIPNPQNPAIIRPLIADDVEEVATRIKLRAEVLTLHTGFSFGGATSTSTTSPSPQTNPEGSSPTPMSRAQLGRSSVAARRRS